jgi:hypothetical protein
VLNVVLSVLEVQNEREERERKREEGECNQSIPL